MNKFYSLYASALLLASYGQEVKSQSTPAAEQQLGVQSPVLEPIQIETAKTGQNYSNEEELYRLIQKLQNTTYRNSVLKLYQKRLLFILPKIANGYYVDTNLDTVMGESNGTTALHNACGLGNYEIVEWLLRNGADANAKAKNGATPEICIGNDPSGRIRALLRKYTNGAYSTGGASGTSSGEIEELYILIYKLQNTTYRNSVLKLYQKRLLFILPKIANGYYVDTNLDTVMGESNGTTALHNACGLGNYEIVEWLLRNGANANAKAKNGASPEKCIGNDPSGRIRALIQRYK